MKERNERLKRFFTDNGLEKVFVRCYGIGGHFYNVEVRTVSPITLSLVKELFDKKFFNIRITDNFLSFIFREGNGTPPQYSFLENPMDGGAC